MFNSLSDKGNTNHKCIVIPSHSSQNDYDQENNMWEAEAGRLQFKTILRLHRKILSKKNERNKINKQNNKCQ
jgi:hypothetical protein